MIGLVEKAEHAIIAWGRGTLGLSEIDDEEQAQWYFERSCGSDILNCWESGSTHKSE
jgi:hypothetical protein